jgi:hypothetical protein
MILHARFEGVHAALIHSPCLTRSLMLDEKLAQSSLCIIIITFSFTLYRCLFFHKFSSLSRSDHVENNSFHVWCMKFYFHQVFIHPQRTPIEWVMPVLPRRCNLSKADFRLHITQCFCHISLYGSSNWRHWSCDFRLHIAPKLTTLILWFSGRYIASPLALSRHHCWTSE